LPTLLADHSQVQSGRVLGVRVDCLDMEETLAEIERMMRQGGGTRLVATVNPEFVMRARRDGAFRAALDRAEVAVADGFGVVWALRRQGCSQQERVTGIDLTSRLAERCARQGRRLFLLGAEPGVAAEAGRRLVARFPGLVIAGAEPGSPWPEDDEVTAGRVNRARADLLLVAYGHPKQELWIDRNRERLRVPVAIGVGGAFDFLAGRVPRAPAWMRRLHFEWLWRLLLEPTRLRRIFVAVPLFGLAVLAERRG
jgi:N-acetylglucosaminyldiphosphoundecaprenol N-acetyl-beta-D-mannosaminyltransferase